MSSSDPEYLPTPAEIEAACKEIRATWSEKKRQRRLRVDLRPVVYELMEVSISEIEGSLKSEVGSEKEE